MKKLKGCAKAIKMKYLIFVFVAAMLVALPTRVYQLLALVNTENGFYEDGDITVPVLYGVVAIFGILFLILSYLSKEIPNPKLPTGKNPILGISAAIMSVGFLWDILAVIKSVVPGYAGGTAESFISMLQINFQASGGALALLQILFAVFAIFYLIIFAVSHLNGKASYKEYKLLALAPVCWAIVKLIGKLMNAVSFITVSELLFEIFMFVFTMLFFLTFARICTGVFTEDSMWGIYGYGFSASLFAGLVTIPRVVCMLVGLESVEGHPFNFADFSLLVFILSYIIASLGIGFKDGFKNMRTVDAVDLPDDSDVVIKHREEKEEIDLLAGYDADDIFDEIPEEGAHIQEETVNAIPDEEIIPEHNQEKIVEIDEENEVLTLEEDVQEEPEFIEEVVEEIAEHETIEKSVEEAEEPEVIEETVESEIIEESVEETVEPEVIEEENDETINFSMFEAAAVEEVSAPVQEKKVKKAPRQKKEKVSLFGLRKAPVQKDEEAEDLKPISLADLKKNNE